MIAAGSGHYLDRPAPQLCPDCNGAGPDTGCTTCSGKGWLPPDSNAPDKPRIRIRPGRRHWIDIFTYVDDRGGHHACPPIGTPYRIAVAPGREADFKQLLDSGALYRADHCGPSLMIDNRRTS